MCTADGGGGGGGDWLVKIPFRKHIRRVLFKWTGDENRGDINDPVSREGSQCSLKFRNQGCRRQRGEERHGARDNWVGVYLAHARRTNCLQMGGARGRYKVCS